MAKYKNDLNRILKQDLTLIIPHGGDDGESSSTVTRVQFNAGDNVRFIKAQTKATLKALGLSRDQQREYIRVAFDNFKEL